MDKFGKLYGFVWQEVSDDSYLVTIDPDTLEASKVDGLGTLDVQIKGAGFDRDNKLWVVVKDAGTGWNEGGLQIQAFDLSAGLSSDAVIRVPKIRGVDGVEVESTGGDIAFDLDGNCYFIGALPTRGYGESSPLYTCDLETGTLAVAGELIASGFSQEGRNSAGEITASGLAFSVVDGLDESGNLSCTTTLMVSDGAGQDEVGQIDLAALDSGGVNTFQTNEVGLINLAAYQNPDMAGFPLVTNNPACADLCGNGSVDEGEQCDSGPDNLLDLVGEGCSDSCTVNTNYTCELITDGAGVTMSVCRSALGTSGYCDDKLRITGQQCTAGEGDCNTDSDCEGSYFCAQNFGADYGFKSTTDVCESVGVATATSGGEPYSPGSWTAKDVNVLFTCGNELGPRTVNKWVTETANEVSAPDYCPNTTFGKVRIDKTDPIVTPDYDRSEQTNGWYRSYSASATATDAKSGMASLKICHGSNAETCVEVDCSQTSSCEIGEVSMSENSLGQQFLIHAYDNAGNLNDVWENWDIKVDQSRPSISLATSKDRYVISETVEITCEASDSASGIDEDSTNCENMSKLAHSFNIGSNTIKRTAVDHAGHKRSASITFEVQVTTASATQLIDELFPSIGLGVFAKRKNGTASSLKALLDNPKAFSKKIDSLRKGCDKTIISSPFSKCQRIDRKTYRLLKKIAEGL